MLAWLWLAACQGDDKDKAECGEEVPYDGIDQDCDGSDLVDVDGDGHTAGEGDCDDTDPAIHPEAEEIWYDGIDQNCDEQCDADQDGDGAVQPDAPVGSGPPCEGALGPELLEDCDDTDPLVSWLEVGGLDPENGAVLVPVGTTIELLTYGVDPGLTLTLTDPDGALVPGTLTGVGSESVTFVPDAPLLASGPYRVEVEHACGSTSSTFSTQSSLQDRTYALLLSEGAWVEPAGVGDLLASQLGDTSLLLDVIGVGEIGPDLRLAVASEGSQDLCSPTSDHLGVELSAPPMLDFEPGAIPLEVSGYVLLIEEAVISGQLRPELDGITDASLTGVLDTRPLAAAFELGGDEGAVCDLVATFGVACVPCPDGSGVYCLDIDVQGIPGPEVPIDTVARTEDDIANDPTCP